MDKEEMKKKIVELIDMNARNGPKLAFYSDPIVVSIVKELYDKWENNGRRGIPLDYASEEQIKILYKKALRYCNVSDEEAWLMFLSSEGTDINPSLEEIRESASRGEEGKSWWKRILQFFIPTSSE